MCAPIRAQPAHSLLSVSTTMRPTRAARASRRRRDRRSACVATSPARRCALRARPSTPGVRQYPGARRRSCSRPQGCPCPFPCPAARRWRRWSPGPGDHSGRGRCDQGRWRQVGQRQRRGVPGARSEPGNGRRAITPDGVGQHAVPSTSSSVVECPSQVTRRPLAGGVANRCASSVTTGSGAEGLV